MSNHDRATPTIAPLLLRLVLGATFLWAGVGKLLTQEYRGATAGVIASMGEGTVIEGQWPPASPAGADSDADAISDATDTDTESGAPPSGADPAPGQADPGATPDTLDEAVEEAEEILDEAGDDLEEAAEELIDDQPDAEAPVITEPTADESLSVRARRVMGLAAMIKMSADGNDERARLVPKAMGTDAWVKTLAWAAVATEVLAGAAMIFGLFTRVAALGIAGTMTMALWLTQIGPAVRTRTGDAFLGFLPPPDMASPQWTQVWNTMLWQFALLAMGLAILCMGAGRLSLDAWVFGSRRERAVVARKTTVYTAEATARPRRPDHPEA